MIKKLCNNIVFVKGIKNSAIYNFNDKKVYSINEQGTNILVNYLEDGKVIGDVSKEFIEKIKELFSINDILNLDYKFPSNIKKELNFVWLEVTKNCSCRCIHCYEGTNHKDCRNPLTLDEWRNVIDELALLKCGEVRFIGGEPTSYLRLPELIHYAKEKKIPKISLFSNLYFGKREELINSIINNNVEIHFSIYASKEDIHDSITQSKGSFNRLINNLMILKSSDVRLVAHVVAIKENQDEIDNIYYLLQNLGINNVKYDEYRKVYGICEDSHIVTKSRINNTKLNFKTSHLQFEYNSLVNTCWYGKCVISSDGNVFPCEMERNHLYGNVRTNTILEILNSNIVEKFWYFNFSKVKICNQCEFRFACRDCRPVAYAEHGDMSDKSPRCKYNPQIGL